MIEIAGIDHIVLRTDKLTEMTHFYGQILGCSVERDQLEENGLLQLRAGNALIDLVTVEGPLGQRGGGAPNGNHSNLEHFCLQIEPVSESALLAFLVKQHIPHETFALRYGAQGFSRSIYIQDPQGNVVELKPRKHIEDPME